MKKRFQNSVAANVSRRKLKEWRGATSAATWFYICPTSWPAISSPIANDAVAAGLGAFRTCSALRPRTKLKSCTSVPSGDIACARTPAKELLEHIHPQPCPEREQIEHSSRAVIHRFHEETKNFSDLYGVFREERHSNLTAEQRETLDERYFNLEARAVARLLAKASVMIKAGRFDEALAVLQMVTHSDIRPKFANLLKAECLRATGKPAEAEKLMQENAQIWPDNPLVRRIFRFVAYIFIEAKRMIFSKW